MNDVLVISTAISVIYIVFKFIEMRFILNEAKPVKYLVRDTIIVCLSVISGLFVVQQITPTISGKISEVSGGGAAAAFTGEPDF